MISDTPSSGSLFTSSRNKIVGCVVAFPRCERGAMLYDPSQKRREPAADKLGSGPDVAWNTTFYHRAIRTKIGQALRATYDLPQELPHQMLALLMQLGDGRVGFPKCPDCGVEMWLCHVEPDTRDHDLRTFECPRCQHSMSDVVKFK
jgi:hypothetical protein